LIINHEIGERRGESSQLIGIGNTYLYFLGDAQKAIEYYDQALLIDREIGDRSGESIDLDNYGYALVDLGDFQNAVEKFSFAISIADEISKPQTQSIARSGLAQAYLFQNDLVNARATIEAALQYDVPMNNHNTTALHGIIALRQGERETVQAAFTKSIAQRMKSLPRRPIITMHWMRRGGTLWVSVM